MDYYYSPANNAFYPEILKDDYEKNSAWPSDGLKVSQNIYDTYSGMPSEGKVRELGPNGYPMWGDIPPLTHDELVATADAEKQDRIDQANNYMNSKQWPGKAAVGRLRGNDLAQYNLWLDYLDELEAVDTSTAPNIEWPQKPVGL